MNDNLEKMDATVVLITAITMTMVNVSIIALTYETESRNSFF